MRLVKPWSARTLLALALAADLLGLVACSQPAPTPAAAPAPTKAASAPAAAPAPTQAAPAPTTGSAPAPAATTAPAPAAAQPVKWRMPGSNPQKQFSSVVTQKMLDKIRERTNGRLDIAFFPGETLMPSTDQPPAVARGTVQAAHTSHSYVGNVVPTINGFALPVLGPNPEQWRKALTPGSELRKLADDALLEKGMVGLGYFSNGSTGIATKKPLSTVADFKGRKLKISGNIFIKMAREKLGIEVVTMTVAESIEAMQRGMLDGALLNLGVTAESGAAKFMTEFVDWSITESMGFWVVNKQAYDALPEDVRKVLVDSAKEFEQEAWKELETDAKAMTDALAKQGMKVVSPPAVEKDKFRELAVSYQADWAKTEAKGANFLELVGKAMK